MRIALFLLLCVASCAAVAATGGKGKAGHASPARIVGGVVVGGIVGGVVLGGAGIARAPETRNVPPLVEDRKINEQDCSKPVDWTAGNLKCR